MLTLNTHSLIEQNYEEKLVYFVNAIVKYEPDIIALQEVNQTADESSLSDKFLTGYTQCQSAIPLKKDNHAYRVVKLLLEKNINYYWTWLPIKNGYDKYDEGLAILSKKEILETDTVLVSCINDYNNWKTRKILGIYSGDEWFYSVHLGWWDDKSDPFSDQWSRLSKHLTGKENVWLMGDFNNCAEIRNEGYDLIKNSGWQDTFEIAREKDDGITVGTVIDGWKDKITDTNGMRIDFIWTNSENRIERTNVIFNGKNEPVISDHYGVMITVKGGSGA